MNKKGQVKFALKFENIKFSVCILVESQVFTVISLNGTTLLFFRNFTSC